MTTDPTTRAADTGAPRRKTISDCQTDATLIHALVQALDLCDSLRGSADSRAAVNATGAILTILEGMADRLANDLDALDRGPANG